MTGFTENADLRSYNSFGIAARAKWFAPFYDEATLQEVLQHSARLTARHLILGGGSNILFTKDFEGAVLHNCIGGIEVVKEDANHVWLKAGAGVVWHQLVLYSIERGWGGLENLSLIPGSVGASPMQNIGAYGVEIKDVFYSLQAMHLQEKSMHTFLEHDCAFGYRESVFKGKYKNQFAITEVTLRLQKQPVLNTSYGAIAQELEKMQVRQPGIKDVSQAVINIRQSKLPDPKKMGNAGSFFKNPEVSQEQFSGLQQRFAGIIGYTLPSGYVKLAAGWLIEQCGWKGFRRGDAGCHGQQALVLVNYANANGSEILALSEEIIQSVFQKFGVQLQREVNIA